MYNVYSLGSDGFFTRTELSGREEVKIMKSVQISLQMASQVKKFVSIVQKYSYEIDLRSGRYVVDAKSILGIFSLDLAKPLTVEIHSEKCDDLVSELKEFAA